MGRNGGVAEWRAKFDAQPALPRPSSAAPRRRDRSGRPPTRTIAERAYFLALEGETDPFVDWIKAERELVAA